MSTIKVKVKDHPEPFVVIEEADFDPAIHTKFDEQAPKQAPAKKPK